jgi:hypothetical protein
MVTMSDDALMPEESAPEPETVDVPSAPSASAPSTTDLPAQKGASSSDEALKKKFRTITGEDILSHVRPSFFGFFGHYVLALALFGLHWLFSGDTMRNLVEGDGGSSIMGFLAGLLANDVTFTGAMLALAWFNRMMNGNTSNRWLTSWLLIASLAPMLTVLDNWLAAFVGDPYPSVLGLEGLLPDYNHFFAGLIFSGTLVLLTVWYQRSFHYAITTDAVIFIHRFLLVRGYRRILFEKISEIHVNRGMLGTLLGFATITPLTDTGYGMAESTRGVATGVTAGDIARSNPDDSTAERAGKSLLRRLIGLIFYQRTVTTLDDDPKNCFYSVRKSGDLQQQLNELQKRHSQSSQIAELKASLENRT